MKKTNNFTFLTKDEIFEYDRLEILFGKYCTKSRGVITRSRCAITDFSILLGGYAGVNYTGEDNTRKDRTGWWWTNSPYQDHNRDYMCTVNEVGLPERCDINSRRCGARPALSYSSIQSISSNGVKGKSGIKEILYGEYPQTIVDENYSRKLDSAYNIGSLRTTGKNYTTDSVRCQDANTGFKARTHTEYEYNGSKYIRFIGDSNCDGKVLSDGREVQSGNAYWIQVEPITWLVDEKADIALSKKILFSGVQYDNYGEYTCDFEKTNIKQFMDNYFSKDIIESKKQLQKKNPYNFDFDGVSEEDIIKGAVESNISVFLHGRSSDGKSARVKQLDPDCEIIYMRNATPDSLNGKSVYNSSTGEMIDVPPTWYSRVLEKCEKEPDKIHIIFFDELTNALPSIQGMAFNIVLDGEVNGKWKLPPNARIVAAGNDLDDSLAANEMAEPLFNRFAHVYINTTVDKWLECAFEPKKNYKKEKQDEKNSSINICLYSV